MKIKYFILPLIYMLTSCVGEDVVTESINISLEPSSKLFSVKSGQDLQLGANITPFAESFATTVWSSSDSDVIEVDSNGVINAKQNGEAIISIDVVGAQSNAVLATERQEIKVGNFTIREDEISDFSEEEQNQAFLEGKVLRFRRTVSILNVEDSNQMAELVFLDFNADESEAIFNIESSDTSILEIGNNNQLIPVAIGSVQITATANRVGEETLVSVTKTIEVTTEETEDVELFEDNGFLGSGDFQSNSSYTVSGSFEIVEEEDQVVIRLDENFSARGVPDLVIYLSNSTSSNAGAPVIAEVSSLRGSDFPKFRSSGEQTLIIPSDINIESYSNVLLYCRRFGVRVGFGTINR